MLTEVWYLTIPLACMQFDYEILIFKDSLLIKSFEIYSINTLMRGVCEVSRKFDIGLDGIRI